ncbi:protein arginine N-methyltransferase 6-like [Babylonia areolata]|uniref:protein arginine N-methyltransferase 6-like n=1 Tax=Babylonia areolata TaxID=304850 RepID=UPI003FD677D9
MFAISQIYRSGFKSTAFAALVDINQRHFQHLKQPSHKMANATPGGDAASEVTTPTMSINDTHGYFASYTDLKVHEVMLRDWPRNSAYRKFFEENRHLVEGKVVMDVGAGTGILSLFAASVGARKVYAVEASSTALLCKDIVQQNGFADRIEVIHSAVEDLDLQGLKVDVIVSEWMGFYLLHESMLDSVIVARNRFLAQDGIMVPSAARIFLAPVNMEEYLEEKYEFWSNVCGFDFSPAIPHLQHKMLQEPLTLELNERQVVAPPQVLREFDLKTVTVSQVQSLSDNLSFHTQTTSTVHGFVIWFDVDFRQGARFESLHSQSLSSADTASSDTSAAVSTQMSGGGNWKVVPDSVLSTSPACPMTHWKQTVILLPQALSVDPCDTLCCQVSLTQSSDNKRHYNIELELVEGDNDEDSDDDDDDHPMPCDCGRGKCQLIRALMEKYSEEQDALEAEAELVDVTAEVEAAQAIGVEMGEDSVNTSEG